MLAIAIEGLIGVALVAAGGAVGGAWWRRLRR